MGEYIPSILGLEEDEKILYIVVTSDFKGMMLFSFENGKAAKVPLEAYWTKTNRKKLIGAYSDKFPICDIKMIAEDTNLVFISDNNKVLCVNTEKIPLKTTKSSQGVQVLTLKKKNAKMIHVMYPEETGIQELKYYTTKNIPAAGCYMKKGDGIDTQISIE